MSSSKEELIRSIISMIPKGKNLHLPLADIPNYGAVKKALQTAGGQYKRGGYFEFKTNAKEIRDRLISGEVINDVKKFQYYPTPDGLAQIMVSEADVKFEHRILEPSAGQGAIAKHIDCFDLVMVEIMPENIKALYANGLDEQGTIVEGDFLEYHPDEQFDRIIANPPFTRNQDITHFYHMWSMLKSGGRIVTIMSKSWTFGAQRDHVMFRKFLNDRDAGHVELDAGTFKESGTNVSSMFIIVDKE